MIITIKKSKFRKILDFLFTLLGWIFLFLFLYNFITHLNSKLNLRFYFLNLSNADAVVIFTFLLILMSAAVLGFWSFYNKRKYGALRRRSFPEPVNDKEIAEYFQKTETELKLLQNDKYVEIK
ncbi:poly-beta-1,6-N-acetyl-D-glucosamine biosynthesis protein PgaD [Neobacillus cucumis]|nr:poly-beta-1,6-N-acetyl-D-glucosamine biosynthesis protein PgaD [Neobacillus cucumis]